MDMIILNQSEKVILQSIQELKTKAGSHSPSLHELSDQLPVNIKIDACFLSNPYATDLFLSHLERDLLQSNNLRKFLELYPSQNRAIAEKMSIDLDIGLTREPCFWSDSCQALQISGEL